MHTCADCKSLATDFIELGQERTWRLKAIAELMMAVGHLDLIAPESIRVLGGEIRGFLDNEAILAHFVFGIDLPKNLDEALVEIELCRARLRSGEDDPLG